MKRITLAAIFFAAIYVAGLDLNLPGKAYAQNDLRPFELFWNGRRIDEELLKDKEAVTRLVWDLAGVEEGDPLEILTEIRAKMANKERNPIDDPLPRPFRGLGGIFAQAVALNLLCTPDDEEPTFVPIHGDITGYHYNESIQSGFLKVETVSYYSEDCLSAGLDNFKHHEWYIFVDGIYQVVPRVFDPANPFPGAPIPPDIIPQITSATGDLAHMTHKLFALGEGIEVLNINENGLPLPPTDELYMTDSDSCIDIFFDTYPPETGLPVKPHYCLGRCTRPAIVGTM